MESLVDLPIVCGNIDILCLFLNFPMVLEVSVKKKEKKLNPFAEVSQNNFFRKEIVAVIINNIIIIIFNITLVLDPP